MAYQPELEKLERRYDEDPARNFAQLAEAYRKAGRHDEALGILREHLAGRPNYVSGLIVLGRCLLDQKNDAEARATFEQVLAVDAEHIIALRALGEIDERTGDSAGARRWYRRLLDIDPMNEDAEAALARIPEGEPEPAAAEPEGVMVEHEEAALSLEASGSRPDLGIDGIVAEVSASEAFAEEISSGEHVARTGEFAGDELEVSREAEPPVERGSAEYLVEQSSSLEALDMEPTEDVIYAPTDESEPMADQGEPVAASDDLAGAEADVGAEVEQEVAPWEPAREEAVPDYALGAAPEDVDEAGETLEFQPFDDSLGWGAGERVSRQISPEDVAAADQAHEDDLEATPLQEFPGLEDAEIPTADEVAATAPVEGLQQVAPEDADVAAVEGFETHLAEETAAADLQAGEVPEASLKGIPVFLPEETAEAAVVEPEPVVTETMAELYVRQGLLAEARETYQKLLAARPHDRRLAARLAELTEPADAGADAHAYAAAATGGQPARSFLAEILAERSARPVATASAAVAEPTVEEESGPGPMDEAFADEPVEAMGEPTQPAKDELSLAAVFGEAPPEPERPPPAPPEEKEEKQETSRPPGGFSFDEFFGGTPRPSTPSDEAPRPPRDTLSDDEGESAFRDWLKGLKS